MVKINAFGLHIGLENVYIIWQNQTLLPESPWIELSELIRSEPDWKSFTSFVKCQAEILNG